MVAKKRTDWPRWWEWELGLVDHVFKRMEVRHFAELDLRRMMEQATGYRPGVLAGRWIIECRFNRQDWEIVVEPDEAREILVVVTALRCLGLKR